MPNIKKALPVVFKRCIAGALFIAFLSSIEYAQDWEQPPRSQMNLDALERVKVRSYQFKEAGDIMIPIEEGAIDQNHMVAELGEVITGKKPSRENDSEITLFKSNGLAVQDVATAKLVYDKALKANVGNQVEL